MHTEEAPELLDVDQLAKRLGVSASWIRKQADSIPALKLGHRLVRYDLRKVQDWLSRFNRNERLTA